MDSPNENNSNTININKRKKRKQVNVETLKNIKKRLDKEESTETIANALEFSYSCIAKWQKIIGEEQNLNNALKKLKKSGPKGVLMSNQSIILSEIIQEDNTLTQNGMKNKFNEREISITQPQISKCLKRLEITRKRIKKVSDTSRSARVVAERRNYALKYRQSSLTEFLFLDETGMNLHTRPTFGYSPKNIPAYTTVPANKGRNVSIIALISSETVLSYQKLDGPYNTESFLNFLIQCNQQGFFSSKILIMDNVRFHKTRNIL